MGSEAPRSSIRLSDIKAARDRIAPHIIRTPLILSHAASDLAGVPVYLKLESVQRTGAFKVRGALSKVTSLTIEERQRGLICASTGNHGLGVAYAAAHFGVQCVVVLPEKGKGSRARSIWLYASSSSAWGDRPSNSRRPSR